MYGQFMTNCELTFQGDPEVLEDPERLKALCQKEVDRFEAYARANDPWFEDGLVKIERNAIAGYLYQKAKGHLDAQESNSSLPVERQDGA